MRLIDLRFFLEKWDKEHRFHPVRRWHFDWAMPDKKVAVEYEGVGGRGKSRHTTLKGYTNDCEKYNAAAVLGWIVLRYTVLSDISYAILEIESAISD